MTSFIFVICMFACRMQFRILQTTSHQHMLLTKIGTMLVLVCPLLLFLHIPSFVCLLVVVVIHIFCRNIASIYEWSKLREAQPVCISALTNIILYMQTGESFRASLIALSSHEKDPFWKAEWQRVYDAVAFSTQELKHRSSFIRRLSSDLLRCDAINFGQVDQIKQIRALYQKEFDFRRRSGQALMQLRLQAGILFGLHIAVSLFMIHQFGWRPYKLIYLASFVLMLFGLITLLKMGRAKQWKV